MIQMETHHLSLIGLMITAECVYEYAQHPALNVAKSQQT